MKKRKGWQQGFTLPELLMVMTIVGLLAGGGLHSWLGYRQALILEQGARQLLSFIARIQANAYWHNETYSVWIKQSGDRWCVGSGPEMPVCPPDSSKYYTRSAEHIDLAETTADQFLFYGFRNTAQSGHLTLSNPAGRVRLVISVRGRLRLCSESQPVLAISVC
ncbi:prepilin peptidase-dependent protein [Pectobacteriaceae bacterium CE70]|uniref:prepilin peptidase-dependent protein n=1 Tax=Brenneria uluponensis TaxID=3057057 RepID=UPI0028EA5FA0|nr:prepilin peptidase-dependent protein [Brenneria ulupoensis]WJV67946.1 prepilin peptidase-dependent protein [Pectobacteriaceae bacterium CE70]WJY11891.1 prepilin peptidase-dependent protein [Pectobacteriaceae bacterium C80]